MSGNKDGVQAELLVPQLFRLELIIDRVEIEKGPHKNFIPPRPSPTESAKALGSEKKSQPSSRGSKGSKKGKKSRQGSKSPKSPKQKKSKSGSKSPKDGKGTKSKSGSRTPKGKKGKKGQSGTKTPKTPVEPPPPEPEKLEGNRKELPPLRVGIDIFNFKDVYITQIDVDQDKEESDLGIINDLSSSEGETEAGTKTGTVPVTTYVTEDEESEGPVDPVKLSQALAKVQLDEKKHGKRMTKRASDTDVPPTRTPSQKSKKSSKSKKDSKKGKGAKAKTKEAKGKKKNKAKTKEENYILKKIPDPDSRPPSLTKDTWSLASERAFKRGAALMFTETPADLITSMIGTYVTLTVDRYGGKDHNSGARDPVGYLRLKFPTDWMDAIIQVNSVENPPKSLPLTKGLTVKSPLLDEQDQEIGSVSLQMALQCFKDSMVSKTFPSESNLYDVLNGNLQKDTNDFKIKSQTIPQYYDVHPRAKKMNYTQYINL